MLTLNNDIKSLYNQILIAMDLIRALLFPKRSKASQAKLKYDKEEKTWMVVKENSILFLGSEEQCQKYITNTLTN